MTNNSMASPATRWFIFYKDELLLQKKDGVYTIPSGEEPPMTVTNILKIPDAAGNCSCAASLSAPVEETDEWVLIGLRPSFGQISDADYKLAGKAFQLIYWDQNSRFCSACGTPTVQTAPICKQCPACKKELYPPISTAMIVLIRKEDTILLVRARNFTGAFHGLVAGFLEPGETLEECVHREVMEETGLAVRNVTYFDNQPWPYPSGLMIGFIADYAGGELRLQEDELLSAAFYTRNNLPHIPRKLSLARKLIDWWVASAV